MGWNSRLKYDFPETAEWFEEVYPENIDDLEPEPLPAVEFRFRVHKDSKEQAYVLPGLRLNKNQEYKIECKPELNMKTGDFIRFDNNDNAIYKITNIEFIIDDRNKYEYIYTTNSWPGKKQDSKILILTLQ